MKRSQFFKRVMLLVVLVAVATVVLPGKALAGSREDYTMSVGETKWLSFNAGSKVIHSAGWYSNAPEIEIVSSGVTSCYIKVNSYVPVTVIVRCYYDYWLNSFVIADYADFHITIREPDTEQIDSYSISVSPSTINLDLAGNANAQATVKLTGAVPDNWAIKTDNNSNGCVNVGMTNQQKDSVNLILFAEKTGSGKMTLQLQDRVSSSKTIIRAKTTISYTVTCSHSYDNGKITKESTVSSTGTKTYTCRFCGNTRTESIPELTESEETEAEETESKETEPEETEAEETKPEETEAEETKPEETEPEETESEETEPEETEPEETEPEETEPEETEPEETEPEETEPEETEPEETEPEETKPEETEPEETEPEETEPEETEPEETEPEETEPEETESENVTLPTDFEEEEKPYHTEISGNTGDSYGSLTYDDDSRDYDDDDNTYDDADDDDDTYDDSDNADSSIYIPGSSSRNPEISESFGSESRWSRTQEKSYDLSECTIQITKKSIKYTGKEIKPYLSVRLNGRLVSSRNYKVTYYNNIDVGTASAVIEGVGDYYGSQTKTFIIEKGTPDINVLKRFNRSMRDKDWTLNLRVRTDPGVVLSYACDDSRLKVDENGVVYIPAGYKGTAQITISAPETDNWKSTRKTVEVRVK